MIKEFSLPGSTFFIHFVFFRFFKFQYQRWLYPVDKNRLDNGIGEIDTTEENASTKSTTSKKNE